MEKVTRKNYPTALTDSQWAKIVPLFFGMRKRKFEKRGKRCFVLGENTLSMA